MRDLGACTSIYFEDDHHHGPVTAWRLWLDQPVPHRRMLCASCAERLDKMGVRIAPERRATVRLGLGWTR